MMGSLELFFRQAHTKFNNRVNSLVKHQSSTQAKKQQQNSLVPEAKCQSDVYQAGRLKLGVGTVPFKNAGSAPALAA